MAGLKVHGNPISPATQRVLSVVYEKDLQYEFVNVNLGTGEHKQLPFLSFNPFGQVPAFQHGDLTLWESRAITKYLSEEFSGNGTQLLSGHKGLVLVWTEVEGQKFDPIASKLAWEIIFKPIFGMTMDEDAVKQNVEKLEKVLDVYESRLSNSKYLAGDEFGLADLHHQPTVQCLMGTQCKASFEARPHVAKWVADILSRPAWAKALALKSK